MAEDVIGDAQECYSSTYTVQTTDTRKLLRFIRNLCRKLGYDLTTETIQRSNSNNKQLRSVSGTLIGEKKQETEVQVEPPNVDPRFKHAAVGVGLLTVGVSLAMSSIPAFFFGGSIVVCGLGVWQFDAGRREIKQVTNALEIQIDGTRNRTPVVESADDSKSPVNIEWDITVETTVHTPYPEDTAKELESDVRTVGTKLEQYSKN